MMELGERSKLDRNEVEGKKVRRSRCRKIERIKDSIELKSGRMKSKVTVPNVMSRFVLRWE